MAIKLEEDGFVDVEMSGVSISLDLYSTYNRMVELYNKVDGQTNTEDFHDAIKELMANLGFPRPSSRLAGRFFELLADRIEEIKKKESVESLAGTQKSAASMDSRPGI